MNHQTIQLRTDAPNPVTSLSGYQPTTGYWGNLINLSNALIIASAEFGYDAKRLQKAANYTIDMDIFSGEKSAVEWAEFVMAINHVLWAWHSVNEEQGIEELEPVLKALNELYYEWHDKALKTLKGDDLSTYLTITD